MKRVMRILTASWLVTLLVTLIGALAIALLIWFLGQPIAFAGYRPLESDLIRALLVIGVLIGWGGLNILVMSRAAARNAQMIDRLAGVNAAAAPADGDDGEQLRQRLDEALRDLRRLRGADRRGSGYLYELPWYLLIGPPGSGKTTALTHSGLSFPLAEKFGRNSLRGVSGTRNCDWFLTDEAVLLDTAGRYTTQDSDEPADKAAWLGFLDLLKEYRPRQPINGALVAMSLTDLAMLPEPERKVHARAIRARLGELRERFGVRFPVYVLFTKADLLAGFVETFEATTREERDQVWGTTFPLEASEDDPPAVERFADEFGALLGRVQERMIERVQHEADLRRRGLVFGFPTQLASLADATHEFLEDIFRASRFESRPLLRGVYFTSGTQEGTPIDRLITALVQRFGVQQNRLAAHSGTGRSYFLTRLLREVIFSEAAIVSSNPRLERRERLLRWAVYGGCAALLGLACTAWTVSYAQNRAFEARLRAALDPLRAAVAGLDVPVLPDSEPVRMLPALAALRDLPAGQAAIGKSAPVMMRFGLYQGDKLGSQAVEAYRRGLNVLFLPRMLARLQDQLRGNLNNPAFLYQALKVYLLLSGEHELDAVARREIQEWMTYDWEAAYPGPSKAETRAVLRNHLDALLDIQLRAYSPDRDLIDASRRMLLQVSLAGRAYAALKERAAAADLGMWRAGEHAGPAADRVLVRPSGKLLSDGVPGFYTREGFYDFVLPNIATAVKEIATDNWVLGPGSGQASGMSATLDADILKLYYDDYIRVWDALIADIAIVPLHSSQQAADALLSLSGSNSALRLLWQGIADQTRLSQPVAAGDKPDPADKSPSVSRIEAVLAPAAAAARPTYGLPVEAHFRDLRAVVLGAGSGPTPLDDLLRDMGALYEQLNRTAGMDGGGAARAGELAATARKIEAQAARLPPAMAGVVRAVARAAAGMTLGAAKAQLDAEWKQKVVSLCVNALEGRYPLRRGAENDATPDDFARLFAPNGLIDTFFNNALRPFVDTSKMPWRAPAADQGGIAISPEMLQELQLAAKIRDSYFGTGATPTVRFEITPLWSDPEAKRITLAIDGQEIAYEGSSPHPTIVQWPGPGGVRQSQITVEANDGQKYTLERRGPWSLLRLFDAGQLDTLGGPDRWRATFTVGPYRMAYQINAGSVMNPLAARDLDRFRCPRGL